MDDNTNTRNLGVPQLEGKGSYMGMNTSIVTMSGSNAGIGFAVHVDWFKPTV